MELNVQFFPISPIWADAASGRALDQIDKLDSKWPDVMTQSHDRARPRERSRQGVKVAVPQRLNGPVPFWQPPIVTQPPVPTLIQCRAMVRRQQASGQAHAVFLVSFHSTACCSRHYGTPRSTPASRRRWHAHRLACCPVRCRRCPRSGACDRLANLRDTHRRGRGFSPNFCRAVPPWFLD
jgi:hypothetical protein